MTVIYSQCRIVGIGLRPLQRWRPVCLFIRQREAERENGTAIRTVINRDGPAMNLHDLRDYGESQTGALRRYASATPKPFENPLSILLGNAWPLVGHTYASVGTCVNRHLGPHWRMRDPIFDKVPDRIRDCVRVPFHQHGLVRTAEGDCSLLPESPGRQRRDDSLAYFVQIDD